MNNVYVHPTAVVETRDIGEGTRIWAFTHVMGGVSIGTNCNIGEHSFLETGVQIGNDVTIKNGNQLWDGVTLQDGAFVGPGVLFTNDRYPRSPRLSQAHARYQDRSWLLPTLVEEGASIGAGAVILPGVTIGRFAMIGAGALVTSVVPAYALMVGNPARLRSWVCECGRRLLFRSGHATCSYCGLSYSRKKKVAPPAGSTEELPLHVVAPIVNPALG
jgi:UDP-2-acetamido-3-amino-2,3-dideoxy-glucuronate N-acetyltransferase